MKPLCSAFVFGIGFWMLSGSPARAQVGGMGETLQKEAGDAVKQEVMKGAAEKAGLPAPGAPAVGGRRRRGERASGRTAGRRAGSGGRAGRLAGFRYGRGKRTGG